MKLLELFEKLRKNNMERKEGENPRILMINNTRDENPSYVIRNKVVAAELERRGYTVFCKSTAFNVNFDDYDVFIFNRFYEGTLLKYISFLKSAGKTVIYETDDNYEGIDESHAYVKIRDTSILSSRELIQVSDGITVSTPELKSEISKMFPEKTEKIFVIPNALNFDDYKERKGMNSVRRIGFQGSNIHVRDLLIVIDAIKQLQDEFGFDFFVFGIDDKPFESLNKFCEEYKGKKWAWMNEFPMLYKKLSQMRYTHIKSVPYHKYREVLSDLNLDIGIAPLTDSLFNRSKSCLKYYEYAAVGTVTLASDVLPYSYEMDDVDLVKNRADRWKSKLRRLLVDYDFYDERAEKQIRWVRENRDIRKIADMWEYAIKSIKQSI